MTSDSTEAQTRRDSDPADIPDLILRLTALVLLLRPLDLWWACAAVSSVAGLALLFLRVRRTAWTWLFLAAVIGAHIVAVWPAPDNHIYLLAYWCLAIGLALLTSTPGLTLAAGSRALIGAAFTLAIVWKTVLSPDYLDGRFFRVTLLTDDRFADAVMLFGGLTAADIEDARAFLRPLPEGAQLADGYWDGEPFRLRLFAAMVSWGGLALEGLIAVTSLLPLRGRAALARHAGLLLFCATTYALAPVAGFGWLLATMGLAQCAPHQRTLEAAYVSVYVLIMLYADIPWASLLLQ